MTATDQLTTVLHLRPEDHVAIATADLAADTEVAGPHGPLRLRADIPRGHKVAVQAVDEGGQVLKYGQSIGVATKDIRAGDHVHTHNLVFGEHEAPAEADHTVAPAAPPAVERTAVNAAGSAVASVPPP